MTDEATTPRVNAYHGSREATTNADPPDEDVFDDAYEQLPFLGSSPLQTGSQLAAENMRRGVSSPLSSPPALGRVNQQQRQKRRRRTRPTAGATLGAHRLDENEGPLDSENYEDLQDISGSILSSPVPLATSLSGTMAPSHRHASRLSWHKSHQPQRTLRRAARVSRQAALTTKQQWWDSNTLSIDTAFHAVDQWEALYNAIRNLIVLTIHQMSRLYQTGKSGASSIEHGIFVPVRDWMILPTLGGIERVVTETIRFMGSPQAKLVAHGIMEQIRQVPLVGENVLAPSLWFTMGLIQRTWEIVQYPIPSRERVRDTVEFVLNGTKWSIVTAGHEIVVYVKRADAILTRTLSHTQWKLLGSGPYATLDAVSKQGIIDHLCERYLDLATAPATTNSAATLLGAAMARYELAAHVRDHNPILYFDLVVSGVLQRRGGALLDQDEWLSTCPAYRALETPFLLQSDTELNSLRRDESQMSLSSSAEVTLSTGVQKTRSPVDTSGANSGVTHHELDMVALWFRLPNINGVPPSRDSPWIPFRASEQRSLESRYRAILEDGQDPRTAEDQRSGESEDQSKANPSIAKWYIPDCSQDVLVDQKRHSVSFYWCCFKCRGPLSENALEEGHTGVSDVSKIPPFVQTLPGQLCSTCRVEKSHVDYWSTFLVPPPIASIMRPNFWRFYGQGDSVRRSAWFLDTPRSGLQPFDETAQSILEDAYLFLKWVILHPYFNPTESTLEDDPNFNGALLTVEVPCPDGKVRLVQFSSLTQATAIHKGVGAAVSLFKRRVYRGAWIKPNPIHAVDSPEYEPELSLDRSILEAVEENGSLGDTMVPDMSIRQVLTPRDEPSLVVYSGRVQGNNSLAAAVDRLYDDDMAKHLDDLKDSDIDHLVLIVHGIGEMMRSVDVLGLPLPNLASIVECVSFLRKNHAEVQDVHFSQMYSAGGHAMTGRVEYLPCEWHEAFSIVSARRKDHSPIHPESYSSSVQLKDITLRTIPNMREFANDALMDVLYFMSPEHHDIIIDIVAREMNLVVRKFRELTGFRGRFSVIGHSLGSIVAWDILNHQYMNVELFDEPGREDSNVSSQESFESWSDSGSVASLDQESGSVDLAYPQLDFPVDNFFLLGSPVAVFLMIRNQREPLNVHASLKGCNRIFNIFHPYDPVAYRIEPCIDPRNAAIEPTIVKHWNGGFRVQYQTKRLWRKLVDTTWKTQQSVVEAFEASMAGMGLLDTAEGVGGEDGSHYGSDTSSDGSRRTQRVTCGRLNRGRRIDYMLQEKEVENANEYVAALGAHSSYWIERDLSLFIARQVYLSTLEYAAADSWESVPTQNMPETGQGFTAE
jgi:DDHD domain